MKHSWTKLLLVSVMLMGLFLKVDAQQKTPREIHLNMSVSSPEADNSVETELQSFEIADGYEVTLFADETDQISNPIAIRWDARGRLWVLCTLAYPQIFPTEKANDKIFILEDTDGDGRADKTIVFVDGLNMPTGFALGDGGVYIGEGENLIFLRDTDGDDRADLREEIFSGFGTGDTHQNINSFAWSPDGELLFCQGLHCFSRIETPWGIARMNQHGVWRLRPRRQQLHAFRGGSGLNPWGIAFGQWGEPFVKGNNSELSELLPIMVPTERRQTPLDIGRTQIKSMICEIVDSPALPDDLQGDVLIAGYFGHLIDRMKLETHGAGHRAELQPPLLRTDHRSFRPVDIRTGPDGALYIVDWYNPIIGHYQASFRHPDRDSAHGRIWKITGKNYPTQTITDLTVLTISALLDRLKTAPLRERERVREELSSRKSKKVIKALDSWTHGLDPDEADYEHHLFEALCVYAWHESVNEALLDQLLEADTPQARAFATRLVGRWNDRLPNPQALLKKAVADVSPRVRLEAVVTSSYIQDPQAIVIATRTLDKPMDRFIEAALIQTTHALKPEWWPAMVAGKLDFTHYDHLAFVLKQAGDEDAAGIVRKLLRKDRLKPETVETLMSLLIDIGTAKDLRWALGRITKTPTLLNAMVDAVHLREIQPAGDLIELITAMINSGDPEVQTQAVRLAGACKIILLAERIRHIISDSSLATPLRSAAIESLGTLRGHQAIQKIIAAIDDPLPNIRYAALRTLCRLDLKQAAKAANEWLRRSSSEDDVRNIITPFLGFKRGPGILASALANEPVKHTLATHIRSVLGTAGRYEHDIEKVLQVAETKDKVGLPEYSEPYVQALAAEVKYGDAANGAKIYASPALSCVACHRMGDEGGILGPELTAVGAGVPVELLIEAILWPDRQLKEGYIARTLTTKDGRIINGYVQSENKQHTVIRDAATGQIQTILNKQVISRRGTGTLMPPGLTAHLSPEQLRDLIRFLSEQKGTVR